MNEKAIMAHSMNSLDEVLSKVVVILSVSGIFLSVAALVYALVKTVP